VTSPENEKAAELRRKELEEYALRQKQNVEQLIDNTPLFRKTQLLFKNRRKAIEARKKNKEALQSTLLSPKITSVPWKGSVQDRIGKRLTSRDPGWLYRPPTQPRSASPSRSARSSFASSSARKTKTTISNKSKVSQKPDQTSIWPPPRDSNYSTVQSFVPKPTISDPEPLDSRDIQVLPEPNSPNLAPPEEFPKNKSLKFVVCNLCGTQVSGPQQLRIHQNGRKCKNRRLKSKWLCKFCKCTFDTEHNLGDHKC